MTGSRYVSQEVQDTREIQEEVQEHVEYILRLMRNARIMMWAGRWDHAQRILDEIKYEYSHLFGKGEDGGGGGGGDSHTLPASIVDVFELLVDENKARAKAKVGVADENNDQNDMHNVFEWGIVEDTSEKVVVRTYLFDDVHCVPVPMFKYIDAFENFGHDVDVDVDSGHDGEYPLNVRLFSKKYFVYLTMFAYDYGQFSIWTSLLTDNEKWEIIDTIIDRLNGTRTSPLSSPSCI